MNETMLKALIVEDHEEARIHLRCLLASRKDVTVVGEAESVTDAVKLYEDLQPNLIFLDIELGRENGFSLVEKLDPLPAIIFVTGFSEYAVRAFEINAVDYLLKPIDSRRLSDAIERIHQAPPRVPNQPYASDDPIFLEDGRRGRVIFVSKIVGITAEENYTEVLIADGTHMLIRRQISKWEELLPKPLFHCPHRSLIVNLKAIRHLTIGGREKTTFRLETHEREFTLGRQSAARLRRALRHARSL